MLDVGPPAPHLPCPLCCCLMGGRTAAFRRCPRALPVESRGVGFQASGESQMMGAHLNQRNDMGDSSRLCAQAGTCRFSHSPSCCQPSHKQQPLGPSVAHSLLSSRSLSLALLGPVLGLVLTVAWTRLAGILAQPEVKLQGKTLKPTWDLEPLPPSCERADLLFAKTS